MRPAARESDNLYIVGEEAEPGPNPRTRLSLDAIRAQGFLKDSSPAARGGGRMFAFIS